MAGKNTAVFGIYKSRAQAESAVDRILAAGFSQNDISVLLPDSQSSKEFAHEKNTKAPEGTATGVTTGGVVGGTLGLLAGIGALAIPGVGPLIAAGPIVASLAGLGVGALQHIRRNLQSEGSAEADRSGRYLLRWRKSSQFTRRAYRYCFELRFRPI